ncbi:MAG TPA: hypothetical protein VGF77_08300 [Allosphingosinicella sp.]|jgi:hypothetical protein
MFLLAVAAAVSTPAMPPVPAPYVQFLGRAAPGEVSTLRAGAWRFCTSGRSRDPAIVCMAFQDAAVLHVVMREKEAEGPRADPGFDHFGARECHRIYEENGSEDARILDICLAHAGLISPGAAAR